MNKIFRKCRDFGVMLDISTIDFEDSLKCMKSMKSANIPLCVIDKNKIKNWKEFLRNIAFGEDLFIAVENIESITDAYEAAGNGAQFFIFNNYNLELYKELIENGFFFIPFISNLNQEKDILDLGLEVAYAPNYKFENKEKLFNIKRDSVDNISNRLSENEIFKIVTVPATINDFDDWGNSLLKVFLGLKFSEISIAENSDNNSKTFAKLFSATNRCKITISNEEYITLECSDFIRTVNYLKWREFYIDPLNVKQDSNGIYNGILDTKLNNFEVRLEEKNEY